MTDSASLKPGNDTNGFVSNADWIPGFWNYLLDLKAEDLIAELIQNDLDQDATRTVVSFEEDRLICEGNGKPVDEQGWQRLRVIQGAGYEVRAKTGKIGVKNHGLKTAFTIGDELRLASAGHFIVQTLYAKGRNARPFPGASRKPAEDPDAPQNGCRVTVPYRRAEVIPAHGEANVLRASGAEEADRLFRQASAAIPEQFAGVVSPDVVPRYVVVLRHWRLGEVCFVFDCGRPRRISRGIESFRRRYRVTGSASPLPEAVREEVARRRVPLGGRLAQRVSGFYRRGRSFVVEVSWPIDGRGKPQPGAGRFRYPIGYPADSARARTGLSANYSAPFASDSRRQGPSSQEATNPELRKACEELLVDVVARHLVPKWGSGGLNPFVPGPGEGQADEAVRPLLGEVVARGAMPVLSWRSAGELLFPREKRNVVALGRRISTRGSAKEARRFCFIVPAASWDSTVIHRGLTLLGPRAESQLDPRVHGAVVGLLTDGRTPGYGEYFVALNEDSVVSKATGEDKAFRRDFAEPRMARACIDLIKEMLDNHACDQGTECGLIDSLQLPDVDARVMPLSELYSKSALPSEIPGLRLPPVLHPALAGHALLRRPKWRRPEYKMATFLEGGALESADERTRRKFWAWLWRNGRKVGRGDRPKLGNLVIWPDRHGQLCTISDLCWPRSRRVRSVLGEHIRVPHDDVRGSGLAPIGRKAGTSIRTAPTQGEVQAWLEARISKFTPGEPLSPAQANELRSFEADVALLSKDRSIARLQEQADMTLPALAQDGRAQYRSSLVSRSRLNDRLSLPGRFLIADSRHGSILDRLTPALKDPDSGMILAAFAEDGNNTSALQARLKRFFDLDPTQDEMRQLASTPVIPVGGELKAPARLAFRGNRDYWGDWKTDISKQGLSQDGQQRYLKAGVTSAAPISTTSQAFFRWLSGQHESVLAHHVPCVIRHILHRNGPPSWAEGFTDTPFIPVEGLDELRIVPLKAGRHSAVYLSDAGEIGKAILQNDRRVRLVVDHVKEVTDSISETLARLGVRSLRAALKEPEHVVGVGHVSGAPRQILQALEVVRSNPFRLTFRKRLSELEVEAGLPRENWHARLSRIKGVRLADDVEARYRFWRKPYRRKVDAGFDPESGIFWMRRDNDVGPGMFYRTLAEQLVFKRARPIDLHALELAVGLQIKDPSFGARAAFESEANGEDDTFGDHDLESDENSGEEPDQDDPGEAPWGHAPFTPDPTRNEPETGPLTESASDEPVPEEKPEPPDPGDDAQERPRTPAIERIHKEELKRRYASHCQMCLCDSLPQELAPAGSYVEPEEVRRSVIDAHHVDAKAGGGAQHAGNLILLCTLHHRNLGARLTRTLVTTALRGKPQKAMKRFPGDAVAEGRVVELELGDTGEVVHLFFTDDHAKYWLSADAERDAT